MTEITSESLADAMLSCYDHFNRRIGVAFQSHKVMHDFAMALQRQQYKGIVPETHYRRNIYEIFFDTGSSIRMVDASEPENLYGLIFDEVLYDSDITAEEVLKHLESCERRAFYNKITPEMEIDNQPLDDFLNSFHIID